MPIQYENTGAIFTLVETDNINKVPFVRGQYIIVDDGMVYYDPTTGSNINQRVCLTPKREVDVNDRGKDSNGNWLTDEYYLNLCTNPIDGDINIIKTLIDGTNNKKEFTIYTYNNGKWIKETGSYNAKNVYLDDNISLTIPFGNKTLTDGYAEFNTKGLSVYDALNNIFAPEKEPDVILPSIKTTITPDVKFLDYGQSITFNYSIDFDPGKYEFGPETGVTVTKYTIKDSKGIIKSTKSGSFNISNITENYYIDVTVNYSAGNIPNGNKPDVMFDSKKIKAGAITKRYSFNTLKANLICGTLTSQKDKLIKADILNGNKVYIIDETITYNLQIPIGTAEIYLLIDSTNHNHIDSVFNNNTNYDMFNAFAEEPGSDMYYYGDTETLYKTYVYKPANKFTAPAKLTITISEGE